MVEGTTMTVPRTILGATPLAVIEPTAGVINLLRRTLGAAPTTDNDPEAGCMTLFASAVTVAENGAPERGELENITELPSDP